MQFKRWLSLSEAASFSIKAGSPAVPCGLVKAKSGGVEVPCEDGPLGATDMRFEDPGAYPAPYNKMNGGSKFSARVPNSSDVIVYHGGIFKPPQVMPEAEAAAAGFLPVGQSGGADRTPGAVSEKGYALVPDDWYVHAQLLGKDYRMLKPALADVDGRRAAAGVVGN